MNNFFSDLYHYISEHTPAIRNDPEYEQALQAYMEIEREVKEKIGNELLYKYQRAEADVSLRQDAAIFVQTPWLSHSVLLEVPR